jgi:hypothetical protein
VKFRNSQGVESEVVVYSPQAITINEGDIVKTVSSPDVYVIKYKNGKQFKRLILSPSVFNSYQHLKWENIKIVSLEQLDKFVTSSLVQVAGDALIYKLTPLGDTGKRQPIVTAANYDPDSIYEINAVDRDSYVLEN